MVPQTLSLLFGVMFTLLTLASSEQIFLGTDYSAEQGTRSSGTTVTYFDNNDYMIYASLDFGSIKGFLINYAKANNGGELEIRLGAGTTGQLIANFSPARTNSWSTYQTAHVGLLTEVTGVHDVTFVGKDTNGVLNLAWFELSDFSDRTTVDYARIPATEYSNQSGIRFGNSGEIGWFDNTDFVTYTSVNFGAAGTTDGIRFNYAKGNSNGKMEVRSGGPTGNLLATFSPTYTTGWDMYRDAYIGLPNMSGIHDITFVARDTNGILNFKWFEPAYRSADAFPHVLATEYSDQSGLHSTYDQLTHFDQTDYVTYSSLNFGSSGATKSIRLSYAKGNSNGKIEMRLGGPQGVVIATYSPQYTGGWNDYVTVDIPIDLVEGVHDLTFIGTESNGVWNLEWFELSKQLLFSLDTDYKIDDENGVDVQCTYSTVMNAYINQVYNRYFSNSALSAEIKFFAHLGVSDISAAESYVKNNLCGAAQAAIEEM